MKERGANFLDVRHALVNARSCAADGEKWRVSGADVSGDELVLIVAIEAGVIVVTLF